MPNIFRVPLKSPNRFTNFVFRIVDLRAFPVRVTLLGLNADLGCLKKDHREYCQGAKQLF